MADDVNDDGLELDEASFDDFEKKKGTLGELWRENAMVKVGVVVAAAVAIFATIILFGGKDMPIDPSYVSGGSDISAPPGTEETSPSYVAAIEEENEARTEQAIKESGSVLPTPIDPPVGRLTVTENEAPEEDPLQRWRKLQEERLQREMLRSQTVAPDADADAARGEAIQALAEAMATQMQSILEKRATVRPLQYRGMTSDDWLNELNAEREEEAKQAGGGDNDEVEENIEIVLYPAGRIAYAQILTEANSDVPGPVLAQIASGPLSGSRVLGSFSKQKELLTIKFQTVIVDGVSIDIDAVAVDPKTTLPALATDVDHHYLMRVALPMAAAFVEGLASAISESGLTTVTVEGDVVAEESEDTSTEQDVASGIEEAGQKLREILDETADEIEVTVRVEAGTPVGILFLEPVIKPAEI
ncbi:MAG: DotG/IcmE/VirB10 family protein [Alphaproteobacteria bacterium]|jgi:intracellular multiplication protein IcmE|nr:DotG/IcmE/VirB10 family protein [Alphaproteobacteria bacterium]